MRLGALGRARARPAATRSTSSCRARGTSSGSATSTRPRLRRSPTPRLTPYRAVKKVARRLVGGGSALVIGAGGLGQMAIQFLGLLTPARIVVADLARQAPAALELGADAVVDPAAPDAAEAIQDATGGQGAAAVIDVVGNEPTLALAAASLGFKGELVDRRARERLGAVLASSRWPPESLVTTSHWGTRNELEEVVAHAAAGRLQLRVERARLEDVNDVFARLAAGQVEGRAVLVP